MLGGSNVGGPAEHRTIRAVAAFLSPEWIADVDRALRNSPGQIDGARAAIVVEQVVTDTPRGDVRFHIFLEPGGGSAHEGPAVDAHLRITIDFPTAVALLRGDTNAQHALATGRMKLYGDLDVLAHRAGELASVTDVFAAVRATTTVP
jgi:hypothetical protein